MNQKMVLLTYRNSIIEGNRKLGSTDWQLTRVRLYHQNGYRSPWIEEYCSRRSVVAGQQLKIMVSTDPLSLFKLGFFRTGYYAGAGTRLVKTVEGLRKKTRPTPEPDEPRLIECNWEPSVMITVLGHWGRGVSGAINHHFSLWQIWLLAKLCDFYDAEPSAGWHSVPMF